MKNSFVMYKDWREMIERMDNESRGELLLAIMRYQDGEDITFRDSSPVEIAFSAMKPQFDKDEKKYEEICEKRREAGKKGVQAKASKSKQKQASEADNDNDNEDDNDNDISNPLNNTYIHKYLDNQKPIDYTIFSAKEEAN